MSESLIGFLDQFPTEDAAHTFLEKQRWPKGATCPCGSTNVKRGATRKGRPLWYCRACRGHFSVTGGTVMEDSKIPLRSWLLAYHLMSSSKKGISAAQLARTLKLSYRSAWHLSHRIRFAMATPRKSLFRGVVESDEAFVGGKRKKHGRGYVGNKAAIHTAVQRRGKRSAFALSRTSVLGPDENVDGRSVGARLRQVTNPAETVLMTDEAALYDEVGKSFKRHRSVNHSKQEYVRREPDGTVVSTNAAEGLFANLKRQIHGTHHSTSKKHLPKYLEEFDFKYNTRNVDDVARTLLAVRGAEGKRLTLFRTKTVRGAKVLIEGEPEHDPSGRGRNRSLKAKRAKSKRTKRKQRSLYGKR